MTTTARLVPALAIFCATAAGCAAEVGEPPPAGGEERPPSAAPATGSASDPSPATEVQSFSVEAQLSAVEVAQVAREAGVPCGRPLVEAVAVAYGESTWVPTATNYNPGGSAPSSTDHGLWQINDYYWGPFDCDIYDAACNATYMARISGDGSDWSPWHAHGGSLYRSALDDAEDAEAALCDACNDYDGTFADDDGSVHEAGIEALAASGITSGCRDAPCPHFCPERELPREQMAAFLARALELPSADRDYFADDDGSTFEDAINEIAAAGITLGCNPPDNTRFCPDGRVTRAQMATFLARALALPTASRDYFTDDDGSVHESNIDKLREAGITVGCNPPDNTRFCPEDGVTRAQMATFLTRALGLS